MAEKVFVAVDVETTGLDAARDEIIEVGLCRIENGAVTARFSSLIRPGVSIPPRVQRLTGIDDAAVAGAPSWAEVAGEVASFIGSAPLVGHYVAFDAGFLSRYLGESFAGRLLDTCELARLLLPGHQGYSLERVAAALGISYPVRHRALPDAEATAQVFLALLKRLAELPRQVLPAAILLLERGGSVWARFFRETLRESGGSRITAPYAFLESPVEQGEAETAVTGDFAAEDFFGPGGRLTGLLPAYEHRAQQEEMAAAVSAALEKESCLVVEAGTGIGKSLAYLLPVVRAALLRGRRALISTYTVNLQEQLLRKDIPLVQAALGVDFRAALVKGRQHYLCLRRWERLLAEAQRADELSAGAAALFYARVLIWLTTTRTGDFGELSVSEAEKTTRVRIAAAAEGCLGKRCPHTGRCFVHRARQEAERAAVLITNHALLLTDALAGGSVLPGYGPLVVDEAHHLEDVATECLTRSVTKHDFEQWLARLHPLLRQGGGALHRLPAWEEAEKRIKQAVEAVKDAAEGLFSSLEAFLREVPGGADGVAPARPLEGEAMNLVLDTGAGSWYHTLIREAASLLDTCRKLPEQAAEGEEDWAQEFGFWLQEGLALLDTLTGIVTGRDPNQVAWVEGRFAGGLWNGVLKAAPVSVAEAIHAALFSRRRGMVLTSATLTVEGSFDHFAKRVGLDRLPAESVSFISIDSPFAYREKAALCVVRDLPLWQRAPVSDYLGAVTEALARLVAAGGERALVLFTASRMLREVVLRLRPRLEAEGFFIFAQGVDGGRMRLIEEFRQTPRAVLCGTASFWEGVDIPGGLLRLVIIVKLPFPPYEAPVLAARRAYLLDQGRDDFQYFSLPYAVLRFKQGFGRLIRSHRDDGVVVVLDRRLAERSYGLSFIRSLPPLPVEVLPLDQACAWLRDRLAGGRKK
ncbi:MAG: helicase C-terminal domain-containing protein [Bacillota bacterium]